MASIKAGTSGEYWRSSPLGAAASLSAVQVLRFVVRLVLLAVVLRYLGPAQKGAVDIAAAAYVVVSFFQLQTGQLLQTVISEISARGHAGTMRTLLWQAYGMDALSQIVVSGLVLALAQPVAGFYGVPELRPLMTALAVGNLILLGRSPVNRSALLALQRYRGAVIVDLLQTLGEVVGTAIVVLWRLGPVDYVLLTALAPGVGYAYGWRQYTLLRPSHVIGRQQGEPSALALLKQHLRFTGIVSVGAGLNGVYQRMGALVMARFYPTSAIALYTLATSVLGLLWSVVSLPESILLPMLSQAAVKGKAMLARVLDRGWRSMFAYACAVSFLLLAFAEEVTTLAGGPAFVGAVPLVALMAIYPVFNAPDTMRLFFYVDRRPQITVRYFAAITLGEFLSYIPLSGIFGLKGFVIARVVWRAIFSALITVAAMRALHGTRWWPMLWSVWSLILLAAGMFVMQAYVIRAVSAREDSNALLGILVKGSLAVGFSLVIAWRTGWLTTRNVIRALHWVAGWPERHQGIA